MASEALQLARLVAWQERRVMTDAVDLGDELEAFVAQAVRSGRYLSRAAVVRDAVRLLRDHETGWSAFEHEILTRIDAAAPADAERASDRLHRRYAEMADRRPL
ncbi:type II toxin-antitoxin system ParD family antitoxin [Sphingomonas parva]|uniref:Type II toxin-antitoxin system ParD family antitoxin n=1 Tax=Sphingomonas parva TaxID=2555898 RepID=A0A4Y8ZRD2_9SPHN|nr:type II toxin-antitoxin system ParD family antitoxin [Sphingomonas parva]TFI58553.1 type II toxin-antitoxin system ParD family antitoxin [Sphingomonas parva]